MGQFFTLDLPFAGTLSIKLGMKMELLKGIFIGFGLLFLFVVGSCAMVGAGTVVAVNSAASAIGNEYAESDERRMKYADKYVDDTEMERWNDEDVTRNKATHFENHHDY